MSIYLKIITEQKNQNPEKKWPSREKGKNGDKNVFEEKISRIREKVGEKEWKSGHFSFDFFYSRLPTLFFFPAKAQWLIFSLFSAQKCLKIFFFSVKKPSFFVPREGPKIFFVPKVGLCCPEGGKDCFCPEGGRTVSYRVRPVPYVSGSEGGNGRPRPCGRGWSRSRDGALACSRNVTLCSGDASIRVSITANYILLSRRTAPFEVGL